MSPVITVPQVAIGALGKMQVLPKVTASGQFEGQLTLTVSLAGDHRIIDGATMARFSNQWKVYLEDPAVMLMYLR